MNNFRLSYWLFSTFRV